MMAIECSSPRAAKGGPILDQVKTGRIGSQILSQGLRNLTLKAC